MVQTLNATQGEPSHTDFFLPLARRELQADFMSYPGTKRHSTLSWQHNENKRL